MWVRKMQQFRKEKNSQFPPSRWFFPPKSWSIKIQLRIKSCLHELLCLALNCLVNRFRLSAVMLSFFVCCWFQSSQRLWLDFKCVWFLFVVDVAEPANNSSCKTNQSNFWCLITLKNVDESERETWKTQFKWFLIGDKRSRYLGSLAELTFGLEADQDAWQVRLHRKRSQGQGGHHPLLRLLLLHTVGRFLSVLFWLELVPDSTRSWTTYEPRRYFRYYCN